MSYAEIKAAIEAATGLSPDALHIYAALMVQIVAALALRRSLAHPVPWLCALAFTFVDELVDDAAATLTLRDMATAMIVPTALLVLTRYAPSLLAPRAIRKRR